jgi:hypothetical protein
MTRKMTTVASAAITGWMSAMAAVAAPADVETIRRECGTQLRMPASICNCMAQRAAKLNDGQQAFIAATVTKDTARSQTAQQGLTVRQLTQAGMFMATAPAQCARAQ